jgi:hypothetical protein
MIDATDVIASLCKSPEPSIRHKIRVHVLSEGEQSTAIRRLREEIRRSPRVATLLQNRARDGRIKNGRNIYDKWQGAHWILATLADIGYPAGDKKLFPARDQILDHWLDDFFYKEIECNKKSDAYKFEGVPIMRGRHRRCAAQQGNALFIICKLGLANSRCEKLLEVCCTGSGRMAGGTATRTLPPTRPRSWKRSCRFAA